MILRGWRVSVVKSTGYSGSRGPVLNSQHPHGGSQPSITPVPEDPGNTHMVCTHAYRGPRRHTHGVCTHIQAKPSNAQSKITKTERVVRRSETFPAGHGSELL